MRPRPEPREIAHREELLVGEHRRGRRAALRIGHLAEQVLAVLGVALLDVDEGRQVRRLGPEAASLRHARRTPRAPHRGCPRPPARARSCTRSRRAPLRARSAGRSARSSATAANSALSSAMSTRRRTARRAQMPSRVPRPLRLDDAPQVAAGRLVDGRRGERVAEPEDRRAPLLGVGEEIELGVLDQLREPGDGLVDPAGRHELLALGHARRRRPRAGDLPARAGAPAEPRGTRAGAGRRAGHPRSRRSPRPRLRSRSRPRPRPRPRPRQSPRPRPRRCRRFAPAPASAPREDGPGLTGRPAAVARVPSTQGAATARSADASHAPPPMTTTALPCTRRSSMSLSASSARSSGYLACTCGFRLPSAAQARISRELPSASHGIAHHRHPPEDPDDRAPLQQGEVRGHARDVAGGEADDEEAPFPRRRAERRLGVLAAHRIVDDVGPGAAGERLDRSFRSSRP